MSCSPRLISRSCTTGLLALVLSLAGLSPAAAAPRGAGPRKPLNPQLANLVDCATIVANAQSDQADSSGASGIDDWGATGACAVAMGDSIEGWGFDYKHVWLWLKDNGSGGKDLYVCTELFGHPGDSDADGGYASNGAPCDGAFPPGCGGSEGAGSLVFSASEQISLEIDPSCAATFSPRLRFQLSGDILFVSQNSMGSGNPFPTALGGPDSAWSAEPLVMAGPDNVAACGDASGRSGMVVFYIKDFDDYFAAQPQLTPFVFNWRVIGGHSADQLSEDRVLGSFNEAAPAISILKTAVPNALCTTGDSTMFTLSVMNTGNVPFTAVRVADTLGTGLVYADNSVCDFGVPTVNGNAVNWSFGLLGLGETKTCSFTVQSSECEGDLLNIAHVYGDVSHPCLEPATFSAADTVGLTCEVACVDVEASDTTACVGTGVDVPVRFTNCGSDTERVEFLCSVDGAETTFVYPAVAPGDTVTAFIPVRCEAVDTVQVSCTVNAYLLEPLADCTSSDRVDVEVRCREAGVLVDVTGGAGCVGDSVQVEILLVNTSTDPADLVLNCLLGETDLGDTSFFAVPAGDSVTVVLAIACTSPDTMPVTCTADAFLVGDPACTDRDDDTDVVICREAAVDLDVVGSVACIQDTVYASAQLINTSSAPANLVLRCTVDGGEPDTISFADIPVGDTVAVAIPVFCATADTVLVECQADAYLVIDPSCNTADAGTTASDADTVFCREPSVAVVVTGGIACVGDTVQVEVEVTNTSSEPADLVVTCSVDGLASPPDTAFAMAAGASRTFLLPVACQTRDTVLVACEANAYLISDPACNTLVLERSASDQDSVLCREPGVLIDVMGGVACVTDTVQVEVKVTNTSSETADLVVLCTVDGVPLPADTLSGVLPGVMQSLFIPHPCEDADTVEVSCTADAYLVSEPECNTVVLGLTESDQDSVICREPSVAIDVIGGIACIGDSAQVEVRVTNTSSETADLVVNCSVDGVPRPPDTILAVPPGASDTLFITHECETADTLQVLCTADAYLLSDRECNTLVLGRTASDLDSIVCREPRVSLDVVGGVVCVQDTFLVEVHVTNESSEPADLVVNCTVDGLPFPLKFEPGLPDRVYGAERVNRDVKAAETLPALLPGESDTLYIPIFCEGRDTVIVSCTADAYLVSDPECNTANLGRTASAEDSVICREPSVAVDVIGGVACVEDTVQVEVKVTNTSSDPADLVVLCTVDGVLSPADTLFAVAPGAMQSLFIPHPCEHADTVDVSCTADAYLVSDPTCNTVILERTASDLDSVICRQASVGIDVVGGAACIGDTVQVEVRVTNTSSETANLVVSCTLDGAPLPPEVLSDMAPGASQTLFIPHPCTSADTSVVFCTADAYLVSDPGCTATASDQDSVFCREPKVLLDVVGGVVCVQDTFQVEVRVTNASSEPANLVVNCTVDGVVYPVKTPPAINPDRLYSANRVNRDVYPVEEVPGLLPGESDTLYIPIFCEGRDTVLVHCTADAYLISDEACNTADLNLTVADSAEVICREPSVAIDVIGGVACAGDTVQVAVQVRNTSSEAADLLVGCDVDGTIQAFPFSNVPPNGTRDFLIPVACTGADTVRVTCEGDAYLVSDPQCNTLVLETTAEGTDTVICRQALVDITLTDAAACVGDTVRVPVLVENESSEAADLTVNCFVDGVPRGPQTFPGVAAGDSRAFTVDIYCEAADTVEVRCAVEASLASLPTCTATDADTAAATCSQLMVAIDVEAVSTCVGETVEVPVIVQNLSSGDAFLSVEASVKGGAPTPVAGLSNPFGPGETDTVYVSVTCEVEESVAVAATVNGYLLSNETCTGTASDTADVICSEAVVQVEVDDAEACAGTTAAVPVRVINPSSGAEVISLTCTVDGAPVGPAVILNVAAGDTAFTSVPVTCTGPDTVAVRCSASAYLLTNEACTDTASEGATVICRQALVDITLTDAASCVGDTVRVPVLVENESLEPANLTVNCFVDGVPRGPQSFPGVAAGDSRAFTVDIYCEAADTVEVRCTVDAALVSIPTCTATDADTATATCSEAVVTIDVEAVSTCVAQTVQVPIVVQSLSSGDANLTVTASVNGGAPAEVGGLENPFTPGEKDTVYVSVTCAEEETVSVAATVSAYLLSNDACTDAASDTADVICGEALVQVEMDDAEACASTSSSVPVRVINPSSGAEVVTLTCTVDGVPAGPPLLLNVAAGDTAFTSVPVTCTGADTMTVRCKAEAYLSTNQACTAVDSSEAMAVCVAPLVDIEKDTNPRNLTAGTTSKVTLVVTNTGTSVLDPVRVRDLLPPGLVLAADPDFMATCTTTLSGGPGGQLTLSDFVLEPGETCTIMYRVTCDGGSSDTLINRAVVDAWCAGTIDDQPPVPPVSDADTAWVRCEEEMECPEPQNICFWQAQCDDDDDHDDWHGDLASAAAMTSDDDSESEDGERVVCDALMEKIARCVVDQNGLAVWKRKGQTSLTAAYLRSVSSDGVLVDLLCKQLINDGDASLRDLAEGQYLTLLMNVCAWAISPTNPVDVRGYEGTVQGVLDALAAALNGTGDVKHWTEVACSVNNGIGVFVPEECKPECEERSCTFTQGYWKNHPGSWPVSSLQLGTTTYTKAQLLNIFTKPVAGNGLISLAHQLIAAKLNVLNGTSAPSGVLAAINQADQLINGRVVPPVGTGYLAPGATSGLTGALDAYNSGRTGPGHCDDGGDDHSGDDHSGDDGGDHDGGDHDGGDHRDGSHDGWDDDSSDDSSGRMGGGSRGGHGGAAPVLTDDSSDHDSDEEDCCTLELADSGDHHDYDDHDSRPDYGCCGAEESGSEQDAVTQQAASYSSTSYGDDDHSDDDHSDDDQSGDDHGDDDHSGDDHSGDDHSGDDCEDHGRLMFIEKMGLCPEGSDDDDSEDHGQAVSTQAVEPGVGGPIRVLTLAGYPNPVQHAPMTLLVKVPVHLESTNRAELGVFDVTGRQVRRLEIGIAGSGEYRVEWDLTDETGRKVSSGIYFTRLQIGPEQKTQRILVVRE